VPLLSLSGVNYLAPRFRLRW